MQLNCFVVVGLYGQLLLREGVFERSNLRLSKYSDLGIVKVCGLRNKCRMMEYFKVVDILLFRLEI